MPNRNKGAPLTVKNANLKGTNGQKLQAFPTFGERSNSRRKVEEEHARVNSSNNNDVGAHESINLILENPKPKYGNKYSKFVTTEAHVPGMNSIKANNTFTKIGSWRQSQLNTTNRSSIFTSAMTPMNTTGSGALPVRAFEQAKLKQGGGGLASSRKAHMSKMSDNYAKQKDILYNQFASPKNTPGGGMNSSYFKNKRKFSNFCEKTSKNN